MIPIVSIANLIACLLFFGASGKLFLSYQGTKDERVKSFFLGFLFLATTFFLLATPGLIIKNIFAITWVFAVYPFFGFLSLIYFGVVPLKFLQWEKVGRIFVFLTVLVAVLTTLLGMSHWAAPIIHQQGSFIYWEDSRGLGVNIIIGFGLASGLLAVITFFLIHGFKSRDKYVKARAFLMAAGLIGLLLVSLINFVFGASAQVYITSLAASSLAIASGIIMLIGVLYKYQPKTSDYETRRDLPKINW